ncbi:hypothetical protein TIFTF001_028027 [Ficus carica]|uniref:Uncharacterized protein n=1 Tax=Ficus carica TaxID=3494 RepID=A0AA88DP30_FICCA|nr:hypothetical protein TIFTF001_028027 [Ficus carica]
MINRTKEGQVASGAGFGVRRREGGDDRYLARCCGLGGVVKGFMGWVIERVLLGLGRAEAEGSPKQAWACKVAH